MRLVRRLGSFLFMVLLISFSTAKPALGGDAASLNVLGFSKDGAYFAFEQYGIQDGSGFAYSEIFVVDVSADSWVKPSPFRLRETAADKIEERYESISPFVPDLFSLPIRTRAHAASADLLASLNIAPFGVPLGAHLYASPTAQNDPIGQAAHFYPNAQMAIHGFGTESRATLRIETFELPTSLDYCFEPTKGFSLQLTQGDVSRQVHKDLRLSGSRGCPTAYHISHIYAFGQTLVALIAVWSPGFEGPDVRFIAQPFQLGDG